MANIPKLRLMLARMEKTASARWRTLQGLTALLGKDVVAATPRIGALQLAAKQQGIKLPGEGFAKAMSSLPEGPIGATVNTSKPIEPSQVFRGGKQPADFIRGGYSTEYLHATPFKPIAGAYGEIQQPKLIGPRSKYNELNHNNDSGLIYNPKSLIGVYGTTKNQRYAPDFGFERNSNQQMGMDRLDPNKGLGYAYRAWQDSMRQKDFLRQWGLPKGSGYPADTRGNPLDQHLNALLHTSSNRYETLVKPSQLQSLLLDDRVLPATAKGRELLQTGTMPAGAQLPPEILKSAEELPWRDRVEVYTQNPKGKIYGGIWDSDKSFALPGGGIDEGEDPLVAALRELKEETGITAKNPRLLPIDPVDSPWSDAHRAKIKRNFAGSRTHFVLADAMGRRGNKNLDVWNASNRGYYTPAKAIDIMNSNTNYMAPTAAAARLKALQHIQSLAMAAAKEKSAAPMNLYSYIPNGSIEHVKKHGLLSGNELAKPENRHLLDIARPDGDADRWLKERNARLAKSPWTNSYNGPSAFFGDIDAGKIHDKHPIKKFNTTRAVIKLRELLRDYPATKMEGSELIPFSDTTYDSLDEKGKNEFVNKRHHTLSLDEIKALLTRGQNPKDMWKDFKDTEGKYYASDVPHAQVVTPMGKIPSKYIKFGEADMGKDAVGFSVPDDVLTKHANLARLGMAAAKSLYGLGSAAVKSPIAQNIATGASNLVNTAVQSPMAQNIATRAGNLANAAVQSRAGKTLITGAENLHDKTVDLANRAIQNPIVSRLYAGANKLTDAAIQSPITPNFIKNTFKPGYEAQRQALRRTSREWVQNWDEPAKGFRPMPKKPVVFGPNPSPDRVFRQYKVETTPLIPSHANGVYWNGTDQISARGRGTLEGMRTMRHELAHGLQYKLPSSLPSLQTASTNSPFAGSFLREMNANAASSRTPLGQMGRALGYATSPERLKAYWKGYRPIDKLMHGAAVGTAYGVPLAAATVAGGVGTYNGLHSLASRMQSTDLPHNPEFAQAGPPNPHAQESFPEEVA